SSPCGFIAPSHWQWASHCAASLAEILSCPRVILAAWHCTDICSPMTRITFAPCSKVTAMARLSRFADEPQMEYDEDNLEREDAGDDGEERDALDWIYLALRDGDASVTRGAMALARCFQEMATAAMRGNEPALKHWYRQARFIADNTVREGWERANG